MKSPIKIKGIKRSLNKSFSGTDDEQIEITKAAKITLITAPFEYRESLGSKLRSITECLNASISKTVDVKVKVITKSQNKQQIIRKERKLYKADLIITDETNSVKLIVWEEMIDKLNVGDSYHLKNLTVRIFGDEKCLTSNENTVVETIEQTQDVNLDAEDIQDNICTGICIGVIVSEKDSCFICNHTIEELPEKG